MQMLQRIEGLTKVLIYIAGRDRRVSSCIYLIIMLTKILTTMFFVFVLFAGSSLLAQKVQKTQRVTIALTENGYRPSSFRLRRGVPAKVTFIRKTDLTCGQEIVIPAYGVHRALPLNQPVVVSLRPRRTGTFSFACGMNMLRGKIIVN